MDITAASSCIPYG